MVNIAELAQENNTRKKPVTYSVQSQTNIERKPRKDQNTPYTKCAYCWRAATDRVSW